MGGETLEEGDEVLLFAKQEDCTSSGGVYGSPDVMNNPCRTHFEVLHVDRETEIVKEG